jgi:protein-S-isoprenylcysteine O-methyltransferase Ste14
MKSFQKLVYNLHPYLLSSIASILTVAQIVLAFFLYRSGFIVIKWIGWIFIWTAGIFGILPIITFHRKGGVPKGKSYVNTTVLVDSGIYAIVRHPQGGTSWLLINLGVILVALHWTSLALGLTSMCLVYMDTFKTDQYCIEKFGEAYRQYMKSVPRVNFVEGIVRLIFSSKRKTG